MSKKRHQKTPGPTRQKEKKRPGKKQNTGKKKKALARATVG